LSLRNRGIQVVGEGFIKDEEPQLKPNSQPVLPVDDDLFQFKCESFSKVCASCDAQRIEELEKSLAYVALRSSMQATSVQKSEARANFSIVQRSLLSAVSAELTLGSDLAYHFSVVKSQRVAQMRARLEQVQHVKELTIQWIELLEQRIAALQKCLDAEAKMAEIEQAVKVAEDVFNKSKKRVKLVELSVELGDSSAADLEAAKARVGEARKSYEDALRVLLDIRALGYPELRCSAALKRDQFPNVPEIDADELEVGPLLGRGAFSDVYEAVLPLTGRVALKELRIAEARDELLAEAAAMWEVRHCDHVVRLLKVCTGKRIGLVMEFMEGGTLAQRLKQQPTLDKRQILEIWRDVLLGIAAIHESKQVHLDIKSDNILLDGKGRAKVSDFGTCKQQRQTMRATRVIGTLRWLAPEMLASLQLKSPACDVWSLGMLLYELVMRREPYFELEESQVVKAIMDCVEPSLVSMHVDKDFVVWMGMCWERDPAKRPTVRQLLFEVEKALTRQCGVCMQDFPIGRGVLCNSELEEQHFKCCECLDDEMLSVDCQRFDGAIDCTCGGVFDLAHTRLVVQSATFRQWQQKLLSFKEAQLERHHKLELERERKRWEEEDRAARVSRTIETLLTTSCPACGVGFQYDGGCMALFCKQVCQTYFCGFCFEVFRASEKATVNNSAAHEHAKSCKFNPLPADSRLYLPNGQEQQVFERIQIARIKRNVEAALAQLDANQKQIVLQKVGPLLKSRRINIEENLNNNNNNNQ
jgi:hypothetical protein